MVFGGAYIDGLVQERRNSSVSAMELHLSCTNPSIYTALKWVTIESSNCLPPVWLLTITQYWFSTNKTSRVYLLQTE